MGDDVKKKIDFIITWFNKERFGLRYTKQVKLAKTWMDICIANEEYEMAMALKKELEKVQKTYFKLKNKNRTFSYKVSFAIKKIMRKLRNLKLRFFK